MTMATDLAC